MSWWNLFKPKEENFAKPFCVPLSILAAWTWGNVKAQNVRIAVTNLKPGEDHSQAEALIDGFWTPLTEQWDAQKGFMKIIPSKRHFSKEPYRYVLLGDWIKEQFRWTYQGDGL